MDANYKRIMWATYMEAKTLENLSVPIFGNRANLQNKQKMMLAEVVNVCKLVNEYNLLFGKLSMEEKGIFRNRIILLERRMWNGIYKITWPEVKNLRNWVTTCQETVLLVTKEVIEYKNVNYSIHALIKFIGSGVSDIHFEDCREGDVNVFLDDAEVKMNQHAQYVFNKAKNIGAFVHKLESFLEINAKDDEGNVYPTTNPGIWEDYIICIENKLARAYEDSVIRSMKSLIDLVSGFRSYPMFKLEVVVDERGRISVSEDFNSICEFLLKAPNLLAELDEISIR